MPLLADYGRFPIEILTRDCVLDYLSRLEHLSYTTHRRHQAIVSALFNFAVARGYLKANPIAAIPPRKPDPAKGESSTDQIIRYLSAEQLEVLYQQVAPDVRLHAIVRLLHRTGARIGEILALDLEDIDRQNQKFPVVGKGNKQRWCFYSEDAAIILNKYIDFYREKATVALFSAKHPLTRKVTRLSYRRVHALWRDSIASSPRLAGIRLHDLRHTFATERVGLMSIEELRALMGHTNIQTTLRYQKVTSLRAEEVARKALNVLTIGRINCEE
jgi:integrase/recombinase XerD